MCTHSAVTERAVQTYGHQLPYNSDTFLCEIHKLRINLFPRVSKFGNAAGWRQHVKICG